MCKKNKMNLMEIFKRIMLLSLCFILIFSSINFSYVNAEEKYKSQKGGSVVNPKPITKEYDQGFLTKKATKTDLPGEYWIDLKVQGRQTERDEPADVVLLVDRSWSMGKVQNGAVDPKDNVKKPRWYFAKEAIGEVVNQLIPDQNSNFSVGTVMFDSYSKFDDPDYRTDFTKDKNVLTNSLVPSIQYNRSKAGTNMQAGILNAFDLMKQSNSTQKYIITIGDGAPSQNLIVLSRLKIRHIMQ